MTKIFEILGLIAWFLCFSKEMIFTLKNADFKNFKTNAFNIIRFDKLLLIIIFIIYVNFNKEFVTSLVFTVICFYFFINKFYEKSKKESLKNLIKNNCLTIIITYVFALIPIIYLIITKNYDNTSIILLLYIFFSYFVISAAKTISNLLKK